MGRCPLKLAHQTSSTSLRQAHHTVRRSWREPTCVDSTCSPPTTCRWSQNADIHAMAASSSPMSRRVVPSWRSPVRDRMDRTRSSQSRGSWLGSGTASWLPADAVGTALAPGLSMPLKGPASPKLCLEAMRLQFLAWPGVREGSYHWLCALRRRSAVPRFHGNVAAGQRVAAPSCRIRGGSPTSSAACLRPLSHETKDIGTTYSRFSFARRGDDRTTRSAIADLR